MSQQNLTRRRFVGATAAVAAGLAGCSGGGSSGGSGSNGETTASDGGDSGSSGGGSNTEVSEYLSETSNYDGIVDKTGASEVTVTVGAKANGGNFGFAPPAVRVSTGTTVVWKWNGKGGSHNVVSEDGSFESKLTDKEGFTFSHTFEESGTVTYYCEPHKSLGMKGAIVVEG